MEKVILFLADGFEEIEAFAVVDILRRGGVDISTMSINDKLEVIGKSNIRVFADMIFDKSLALNSEMVILPGGGDGTNNLKKSENIIEIIKYFSENNKKISAICAAPSILGCNGILKDYKAICYPGFEEFLEGAEIIDKPVVSDRNIITSKGPGTAIDFALEILKNLKGEKCSETVRKGLIYCTLI